MKRLAFHNTKSQHLRLLALGLLMLAGCHTAVPPRYLGTWHRVTSKHYTPAIPYCHGYTPTCWSRWPEECQGHEVIIGEEVLRPLPEAEAPAPAVAPMPTMPLPTQPPATESPATEPSFPVEEPGPPPPDDVIVPQHYTEPTPEDAPTRKARPKRPAAPTWSAHLQRYVSEITRVR